MTDDGVTCYETVYGKPVQPETGSIWSGYDHSLTAATEGTPEALTAFASAPFARKYDGATMVAPALRATGAVFVHSIRTPGEIFGAISWLREYSEGGTRDDGSMAAGRRYTLVHRLFFHEQDWIDHGAEIVKEFAERIEPPTPTVTPTPGAIFELPPKTWLNQETASDFDRASIGIAALKQVRQQSSDNVLLSAMSQPPQSIQLDTLPSTKVFLESVYEVLKLLPRPARILCSFGHGLRQRDDRFCVTVTEDSGPGLSFRRYDRTAWIEFAQLYRSAQDAPSVVEIIKRSAWRAKLRSYLEQSDAAFSVERVPEDDRTEFLAILAKEFWTERSAQIRARVLDLFQLTRMAQPVTEDDYGKFAAHLNRLAPDNGLHILRRHAVFFDGDDTTDLGEDVDFTDVPVLVDAFEAFRASHADLVNAQVLLQYFATRTYLLMDGLARQFLYNDEPDFDARAMHSALRRVFVEFPDHSEPALQRKSLLPDQLVLSYADWKVRLELEIFHRSKIQGQAGQSSVDPASLESLLSVVGNCVPSRDRQRIEAQGWKRLIREILTLQDRDAINYWRSLLEIALAVEVAEKKLPVDLSRAISDARNDILRTHAPNQAARLLQDHSKKLDMKTQQDLASLPETERNLGIFSGAHNAQSLRQPGVTSGASHKEQPLDSKWHAKPEPDPALETSAMNAESPCQDEILEKVMAVMEANREPSPDIWLRHAFVFSQPEQMGAKPPEGMAMILAKSILHWRGVPGLRQEIRRLVGCIEDMVQDEATQYRAQRNEKFAERATARICNNSRTLRGDAMELLFMLYLWRLTVAPRNAFFFLQTLSQKYEHVIIDLEWIAGTLSRDTGKGTDESRALAKVKDDLTAAKNSLLS